MATPPSRIRQPPRPRRRGTVEEHRVVAGRAALLAQRGVRLDARLEQAQAEAEASGQTAIAAAWDGEARALLVVSDTLKGTSREAIDQLKERGPRPVLLTGDNKPTADAVAAAVGIDDVIAGVLRPDKVAVATCASPPTPSASAAVRCARCKQNLGWAFGYNIAAIPLAALGLLNPVIAGAATASRACRWSALCGCAARWRACCPRAGRRR